MRYLLHISILLVLLPASAVSQLYTFRKYDHRSGLPTEACLTVTQDAQGYLWVGTEGSGMIRFDGNSFQETAPKGRGYQFHVSGIVADANGTKYISTLYDGVLKFSKNSFTRLLAPPGTSGQFNKLLAVGDNLLGISHRSFYLFKKNGQLVRTYKAASGNVIEVTQTLVCPFGTIIFTTHGCYLVTADKIIPLGSWLKMGSPASFVTGNYHDSKLVLIPSDFSRQLEVRIDNHGNPFGTKWKMLSGRPSGSLTHAIARGEQSYFMTADQKLWTFKNGQLREVIKNHPSPYLDVSEMFIDRNGDLWICSNIGLTKVSCELFTSIVTHNDFRVPNIMQVFRTEDGRFLINNSNSQLVINTIDGGGKRTVSDHKVYSIVDCPLGLLVGTESGVYELLQDNNLSPFRIPGLQSKRIGFMFWSDGTLWISPYGEGLMKYDPKNGKLISYNQEGSPLPSHFYTAQTDAAKRNIYFGSSSGVYRFNRAGNSFHRVNEFNSLGSYAGLSVRDCFGTLWFTLDKGIGGITAGGEPVVLESDEVFPSTLFYTLTTDQRGHLLAGTNKGINILQVDRSGNLISYRNYGVQEGFGGYETNMRSQFQYGNITYIGTIEGLYQVNLELLLDFPKPNPPVILTGRSNKSHRFFSPKLTFEFLSILPKTKAIQYSYRVVNYQNRWSSFTSNPKLALEDLETGNYILEVRSTYDGAHFSAPATYYFEISVPVYRSRWFILLVIAAVALLNFAYLQLSRTFTPGSLFQTQDVELSPIIIPRLIFLSVVLNCGMLALADWIYEGAFEADLLNLVIGSFLLVLAAISFIGSKRNLPRLVAFLKYLAYFTGLGLYLFLSLKFDLHPYGIIGVIIYTAIIPMLFPRLRTAIIISIVNMMSSALVVNWVENAQYNAVLFIITMVIVSGIAVLTTYIRTDSLQKLIFVNEVINRGEVMVISFDDRGVITYVSQNLGNLFALDTESMLGRTASILNPFTVNPDMQRMSLIAEFEDGKTFNVPMYDRNGEVRMIQWSCKHFDPRVLVIHGQDITEREAVATNYRNLVENAQDLIYQTNLHGEFLFLNEKASQVLGVRLETAGGRDSLQFVHPEHREHVFQFYRDQFVHGLGHTYLEFPVRSRDGKTIWLGQNVTTLFEPGSRKRVSGFLAVARDITEKRASDLLIAQQNKDITASINYAKRIQYSLLPSRRSFERYFEDSFVLFRPKDIVSGDFFWMEEVGEKLIFILADCTGHGVPGSFMTVLGINLLNQIVRERHILEPSQILSQLNQELAAVLPSTEDAVVYDGLEALVLVFEDSHVTWSSSGVPFLQISEGEMTLHRNEKTMRQLHEVRTEFPQARFDWKQEDVLYLFTDGYPTQFGSLKNKKFSYRRLIELVRKAYVEVMPLQRKLFENALRNWSEGHEQTDDITVIGIRGFKKFSDDGSNTERADS